MKSIIYFVAITQTSLQRTSSTSSFGLSLNASYLTLFKRPLMIYFFSKTGFLREIPIIISFLFFSGCVNKAVVHEEYNLAQVALKSAEESEAKRYASRYFSSSRKYMKWGEEAYKKQEYKRATEYFKRCRYYSEKAENVSRLKMLKQENAQ